MERRKLSDTEIQEALVLTPDWSIEKGDLVRVYSFESYLDGANFARSVADLAEDLDHHPDILIGWRKVRISVHTHDVGGISPLDFALAHRIQDLGASK